MVDILINVIAEGILRKAISFASEEISLLWGLKEETQRLAKKMQMMSALLCDAEHKQLIKSAAVKLWMERLEDAALDADNVFDELVYEAIRRKVEIKDLKRKKVRNFFSTSNPLAFRHKIATKIKNINSLLDELYREANGIGLVVIEIMSQSVEFNEMVQTGPFVDDSEIVGRNADISSIVSWLIDSNDRRHLQVLSIVGMPGQGKTTLAQLIYKNDKVVKHFDNRLWVCVSDDFGVDRILNEMVEALTQTHSRMTNREAIVKKLQEKLNDKRFLLVLDDVWNENREKWECLKKSILEIGGSSGSKILVTTRSEDVALTVQTNVLHHLNTLSDEESWQLFKQLAFADGGAIEAPSFISIGKRILRRCGGVPLAVKALAGLLYSRKDEREWLTIERSEVWSLSGDGVLGSLRLSYNHLPSLSLKQCFGFCSLFQKDSILETDRLIQLWIAQGFLGHSKENHLEMEEIGGNYLNVLLRNSLLQVHQKDDYGNVRTCKMHDLVHDLALNVSKNYCLMTDGEEVNEEIKVVNLSLISSQRILTANPKINSQRTRTLLFAGVANADMLKKFKKLHVLILHCDDVLEFPDSIGNLKHMRYLDVSETKITTVPDSITKLYHLQTLRLHSLEYLPEEFLNLIYLRHFYIKKSEKDDDGQKICLLQNIGQLKCLRSLPYFIVSQEEGCQINELGDLINLRGTLKIYCLEKVENEIEAKTARIESKSNVDTLEYHWSSRGEEEYYYKVNDEEVLEGLKPHTNIRGIKIVGFHGSRFPSWMTQPICSDLLRNLVKIVFEFCGRNEQIPPLGCLPSLRIIEINWMDNVAYISNEFYGWNSPDDPSNSIEEVTYFPALRQLTLGNMSSLVEWLDFDEVPCSILPVKVFPQLEELTIRQCDNLLYLPNMRSFASLRKLCISFCSSLTHLPREIGMLKSLEEISISGCSSLVAFPDIHGLSSLRKLTIQFCRQLGCLPDGLGSIESLEELRVVSCPNIVEFPSLQKLQSLHWLTIDACQSLRALPTGLEFCTSLEFLEIRSLPVCLIDGIHLLRKLKSLMTGPFSNDLDYFPWPAYNAHQANTSVRGNESFQQSFSSLERVRLHGWPKLTSLPKQLQLCTLTYLTIYEFKGLVALPEWLGDIRSLQTISIWRCENLMYLPSENAMRSLNNLQKLIMEYCPLLEARCSQGTGPEWHKIAHVPEISVNAYEKSRSKNT